MRRNYLITLFILLAQFLYSQNQANIRSVSGIITDELGDPVVGAYVMNIAAKDGVISSIDGNYSITLKENETKLEFSFMGMKTIIIDIAKNKKHSTLNVVLKNDSEMLDEVVIQGAYGTAQKRSDMVGSAFQINSSSIESLPSTRIDDLLDGRIPGLTITPNSDSPGSVRSRYEIRIRGGASLSASNEPLWIVDGTPIYTGDNNNQVTGMSYSVSPLSFINMDDIESMTVLKDASETSIYGANGANGVILVTTKSGSVGKTTVNASFRTGISKIDRSTMIKMLDGPQYLELSKEAWLNGGNDPNLYPYLDNDHNSYSTTNTDWTDIYYGLGQTYETNLSLRSGTEKTKNYLSLSYYNEKSTVIGNDQQRFSIRSNTETMLSKKFSATVNLIASYNINNLFSLGHEYYENLPIFSPYDEDGLTYRLFNKYIDGGKYIMAKFWDNTITEREQNDNRQRTLKASANINLKYNIIKGLDLTAQFGADYIAAFEDIYSAGTNWSGMSSLDSEAKGSSRRASSNFLTATGIVRANYSHSFGKHKVGALLGLELQHKDNSGVNAYGSGFINDRIKEVSYAQQDTRNGGSYASIKRQMSMFAQGSYSYASRYYLTFNVRRDGNSGFGEYVRWGNFGSVGASWNIHNEEFFDLDWMNLLKIKASFGTNGNSRINTIPKGTISTSDSNGYNGSIGSVMSSPPNYGITWETTYMNNIGINLGFLKRIDLSVELYQNYTDNLISKIYTSRAAGDTRIDSNIGAIRNQGIEVVLNTINIDKQDFQWTTDIIVSRNRNKVIELYNNNITSFGTSVWAVGYPANAYYLVKWAGVDPSDGSPMWYDKKGNVTKQYTSDNRVILEDKTSQAIISGSFSNRFEYKDFSLNVMLNYSIGGWALPSLHKRTLHDGIFISDNFAVEALDRWQKPGDLSENPKLTTVSTSSSMYSTRYLVNKTYFKLQNITFSYEFKGINFSIIGDNIALFTPYMNKNGNSYKTYMSAYPIENTYRLSIGLTF